ncbi:UvrB/UvrC motif-containing protein, partial [Patescibacteria group bacterium]|nr:UvrB/UvrC motif-containing protein [Patescibacteria group bacterium]
RAIDEVERRRKIQIAYNKKHRITPLTISKPLREKLVKREQKKDEEILDEIFDFDPKQLLPQEKKKKKIRLRFEMKKAAEDLNFELAALIRDKIKFL